MQPASTTRPLLSVRNLRIDSPGGTSVVRGTDLDVFPGEIVSLLGPSAAGKTTLLKALLTPEVLTAAGYQVKWDKRELRTIPAFVPQRGALFDHLDAAGNIALAAAASNQRTRPADWLADVELDRSVAKEGRPVATLSGGQMQRVAVARTLAAGRSLIALDEPSVGLDPLGVRLLARLLIKQARHHRIAILVVTHDIALAGGVSDRILFLDVTKQNVGPLDIGWPRPAEFDDDEARTRRLAALEGAVEERLLEQNPTHHWTHRKGANTSRAFLPFAVATTSVAHAFNPSLFLQSSVVLIRALSQALVKPAPFYGIVGALLGFTIPFAMVRLSAGLKEQAILVVMGGSYVLSLAPPLSAIIFSATSGSAINAWLGGMGLNGQVLALEGIGIAPQRYLWSPAWLALVASYLLTLAVFTAAMTCGGWILFTAYDVPDSLSRLTANFVDPPPDKLAPLIRAIWLALVYAISLPSIIVAKAVEHKAASSDVTNGMTSSVMRCTVFVVLAELFSVAVMHQLGGPR